MKILTKVVALRNELSPGTSLLVKVEENEKGYKGIAFPVFCEGKKIGFVYQDPKFAEAGCLGITDIIDYMGEPNVLGREWDAEVDHSEIQANGRPIAYINFEIPEMRGKEEEEMPTKTTTPAPVATTSDMEKLRIYASSSRNEITPEAHDVRYSAELLHKPEKPIPVVFEKTADGRIGVIIEKITVHPASSRDKTTTKEYKNVLVGYVKSQPLDVEAEKAECAKTGRKWVQPESMWRMLQKRGYKASIVDTQQLINLCIDLDVEPDATKTTLTAGLASLGISASTVKAKESYLQSNGFSEEDIVNFWQVYSLIHKQYAVYEPENNRYTYISSGGRKSEIRKLFKSFTKSVGSIIVGPPAAGKDEAINTLCRLLNIRVVRQVADANMDADVLIGMQGITNDNGVGVTTFQPSMLMEMLDQPAGGYLTLYVLDEANMANPDQFVVLNELLNLTPDLDVLLGKSNGESQLVSFTRGGDRLVCPWFRMMLTMNVDLEGCKAFNQATWSRLDTIVFGQNVSMKDILLREYPKLPSKDAVMADRLWGAIQKEAKNSGEDEVNEVGPRNFKSAARDSLVFGTPMKEALADAVLAKIQVADTRQALEKIFESF